MNVIERENSKQLKEAVKHVVALNACLEKMSNFVPEAVRLIAKTAKMAILTQQEHTANHLVICPICKGTGQSEDAQTGRKEASCRWCAGGPDPDGYVTKEHAKKIQENLQKADDYHKAHRGLFAERKQ